MARAKTGSHACLPVMATALTNHITTTSTNQTHHNTTLTDIPSPINRHHTYNAQG